jgi:hypothetical protein
MIATIFIAITAFTYSYILTGPNEIFGGIYGKLNLFFKTDKRHDLGKGFHPIFKMIMACEKCVSGQLSLWIYLAWHYQNYFHGIKCALYNGIEHILFVATTIFLTTIIKSIYTKYIE